MPQQIIQFKISLNYSKPLIWRRIQVPATYTFWDLSCAIQTAMGWSGGHLHGFYMANKKGVRERPTCIQMSHPEWDMIGDLDESKELISNWFPKKLKQCVYTYDFGDSWDHTILFEKNFPTKDKIEYPRCIAGKNACPPDDCGGIDGYYNLLKTISRPSKASYKELRDWLGLEKGEIYDPATFNVDEVYFEDSKELLKEYLKFNDR